MHQCDDNGLVADDTCFYFVYVVGAFIVDAFTIRKIIFLEKMTSK